MRKNTLEPEFIDGHYVSKEIKELWEIEINIYKEFKRVCDKYNLKFCAAGGTLLGVIRHNGSFIPWDDDMDIYMPYKDYCIFKKVAIKELPEKMFLQCYETEKGFHPLYSKIRDDRKKMFTKNDCHYPNWNKGVWIDIFPLFNVYDNAIKELLHKAILYIFYLIYLGSDVFVRKKDDTPLLKKMIKCLFIFPYLLLRIFFSNEKIMGIIVGIANINHNEKSKKVLSYYDLFMRGKKYKTVLFNKQWFENYINYEFYDTQIPVPVEYEKILSTQYGDWNTFVKGKSYHNIYKI